MGQMASQPGKNRRNCIMNYRFLGIFDGLTASNPVQLNFFENRPPLSNAENFKEWTFGQFAWIIGLVTLRITTDRTYLRKDVYYGCF